MSLAQSIPQTNLPGLLPGQLETESHPVLEAVLRTRSMFFQVANEAASESASRMQETSELILNSAGEGIYGLDLNGYVTFVNPAAYRITGWSLEDLQGYTQHSMVHHSHPDGSHYPREVCPIYQALRDGQVQYREDEVFWRKDGSCFPVSYTSTPLLREGVPVGAVVVFRDITEQVKERAWESSKAQVFSKLIDQRPLRETLSYLAAAFTLFIGGCALAIHSRDDAYLSLVAESGLSRREREEMTRMEFTAADDPSLFARLLSLAIDVEGSPSADLRETLPLLTGSGETLGFISVLLRGAEQRRSLLSPALTQAADFARLAIEHSALQRQLSHLAQHDSLTGLPNRTLLEDRLAQAIMSARRHGSYLGVCYIDLDRFKEVNDTMGHGVGDEYLVQVSSRLKTSSREMDTLARQGGDEFILLLPDLSSAQEAYSITERLLETLRIPFHIGINGFSPTASIGVSVFPKDGDNAGLLLQNADIALYAAKRAGRDRIQMFDSALGEQIREHTRIHTGLQFALAKDQFRLVYQPILSLKRELQGFEALLRWQHPDGEISPDRFIPIAEESGLIVPIGAWVLLQACKQAQTWQHANQPPVRLAVNVSGVQLSREDLGETVAGALRESGLDPHLLQLEITETWIVADPKAASARLRHLREIGITISVDDFGTGHSSFGCLHDLPLDTLKIDRSFIARLDGTAKQLSTIRAIVMLAQQLGLRTVAEGVETEEQLRELATIDCDLLQGFLFAKPLSSEQASKLLAERLSAAPIDSSGLGLHSEAPAHLCGGAVYAGLPA